MCVFSSTRLQNGARRRACSSGFTSALGRRAAVYLGSPSCLYLPSPRSCPQRAVCAERQRAAGPLTRSPYVGGRIPAGLRSGAVPACCSSVAPRCSSLTCGVTLPGGGNPVDGACTSVHAVLPCPGPCVVSGCV